MRQRKSRLTVTVDPGAGRSRQSGRGEWFGRLVERLGQRCARRDRVPHDRQLAHLHEAIAEYEAELGRSRLRRSHASSDPIDTMPSLSADLADTISDAVDVEDAPRCRCADRSRPQRPQHVGSAEGSVQRRRRARQPHGGVVDKCGVADYVKHVPATALKGIDVRPLDERLGRLAGELLAAARLSDVIDAALVVSWHWTVTTSSRSTVMISKFSRPLPDDTLS